MHPRRTATQLATHPHTHTHAHTHTHTGSSSGCAGASKKLIEMSGRASFLIFSLSFILLGSGVLMGVTGSIGLMKSGLTGFRPVCGRAGAAARSD